LDEVLEFERTANAEFINAAVGAVPGLAAEWEPTKKKPSLRLKDSR